MVQIFKNEKLSLFSCALMMMMIAFIAIKSKLVPLIEGLCAQIYFRFEISVVLLTSSSFLFCERKNKLKETKRQLVHNSTCSPAYIYTCVLRTPHGIYIYCQCSTSGFFQGSPVVSRPDTQAHIQVPHMQCVCVCVHTHTQQIHINPL